MQRSADTEAVIFGKGAARPLMPGVRLLWSLKSKTEACGCQRRAALSRHGARFSSQGPRFGLPFAGRRGRCVAPSIIGCGRRVLSQSRTRTSQCTRPPTRQRSSTFRDAGRRVIGGVMLLLLNEASMKNILITFSLMILLG